MTINLQTLLDTAPADHEAKGPGHLEPRTTVHWNPSTKKAG